MRAILRYFLSHQKKGDQIKPSIYILKRQVQVFCDGDVT